MYTCICNSRAKVVKFKQTAKHFCIFYSFLHKNSPFFLQKAHKYAILLVFMHTKRTKPEDMWPHESTVPLFQINDNTYHHKCYHRNNMNQVHKRYIYIIILH